MRVTKDEVRTMRRMTRHRTSNASLQTDARGEDFGVISFTRVVEDVDEDGVARAVRQDDHDLDIAAVCADTRKVATLLPNGNGKVVIRVADAIKLFMLAMDTLADGPTTEG